MPDTTTVVAVGDPVVAVYTPYSAQFASSKGKLIGAVSTASSTSTVGESQSGTTWGNEQSLVFTDQVVDSQPNSSGNPTGGTATIEQGTTVLCTATVSAVTVVTNGNPSTVDQGSCSPAATALAPGATPR